MEFSVYYKEEEKKISIDFKDGKYRLNDGKKEEIFDVVFINNHTLSLIHNGKSILVRVIEDGSRKIVLLGGEEFIFEGGQEKESAFQSKEKTKVIENIIKSPMPGSVVKLNVKEGDEVKEGDILVIVEAMKMENELRASGDLKVKKIYVKEGDQVEGFAPLIELE
ncbi:MAG: acetyl-CoA carboxylase biotin carboxyl carrier protein subunit [Candidatus Cloacimonadota bacterium]|nr:MAG: acetyl-CoA carboxylase biotin carboxyl carrier protein subunit [Candidatus Cloacimonadota bacterium]